MSTVTVNLQQDGQDLDAGNPLHVSDSRLVGAWGYAAGVDGTRQITGRVLAITCIATAEASLSIDGGDVIPIPADVGLTLTPQVQLVDPLLVFSGTVSYVVEFLT